MRWDVEQAEQLASDLLGRNSERFRHSAGVAERARALSITVPAEEADLLAAAAWLHDIGYAELWRDSGFHPLDGARGLVHHGWDLALARLVAHHSAAGLVARALGVHDRLAMFERLPGTAADALTAADQTVGPGGISLTVEERMANMLERHGPHSPNARVHATRGPVLRATATRVAARLRHVGITDPWLPVPTGSAAQR